MNPNPAHKDLIDTVKKLAKGLNSGSEELVAEGEEVLKVWRASLPEVTASHLVAKNCNTSTSELKD